MNIEAQGTAAATVDGRAVVTKAVVKVAELYGLQNQVIAKVLGVSESTVSRMRSNEYQLAEGSKSFELALFLVRVFRSLDAIVGSNDTVAKQWLTGDNQGLGGRPIDLIQTVDGLVNVVTYLDAARGRI